MPKHFIYPIYTSILSLLTFLLVPRKEIRRLAIYAIIFGGVSDVVAILVFSKALNLGGHINFKYLGAFGIPLFPPISWVAFYIMFLYILPQNKPWKYIFPVVSGSFSLYFAYVLQGLGIFRWNTSPIILMIIYLSWQCSAAWIYLRLQEGTKSIGEIPRHRFIIPLPSMKKENREKFRFVKPKR